MILSKNTKDRYDAIKKVCCVDKPGEGRGGSFGYSYLLVMCGVCP